MTNRSNRILSLAGALVLALCLALPAFAAVDGTQTRAPASAYGYPVTLFNASGITQTAQGPAISLKDYSTVDMEYVISMSGTNTTTLALMGNNYAASLSSSNWVTVTHAYTPTANGQNLGTFTLRGRWTYLRVLLTNSNPVTLTVVGVAK